MKKYTNIFKIYTLKNIFELTLFFSFFIFLFIFANKNNIVIKNSLNVFLYNVFPSLFPFILFTNIILNTNILNILSKYLGKMFSKLFNIPPSGTISVITGFLCGFPMGAKSAESLYLNNLISKRDFKVLLSFINNSNPAFILSTVGLLIFKNIYIGLILLISHLLSSIIIGCIYSKIAPNNTIIQKNSINFKINNSILKINTYNNNKNNNLRKNKIDFFDILTNSILNTFKTLLNIFGYLIFFNIIFTLFSFILSKFNIPNNLIQILSGIFEMTNGCINVSNLNITYTVKIPIISFILGFSGFCVLFQIYYIIKKYNISFTYLFNFKLLHGIISFIISYIILKYFKYFKFINNDNKLIFSFSNIQKNTNTIYETFNLNYLNKLNITYIISVFLVLILFFIYFKLKSKILATKKKGKKSC